MQSYDLNTITMQEIAAVASELSARMQIQLAEEAKFGHLTMLRQVRGSTRGALYRRGLVYSNGRLTAMGFYVAALLHTACGVSTPETIREGSDTYTWAGVKFPWHDNLRWTELAVDSALELQKVQRFSSKGYVQIGQIKAEEAISSKIIKARVPPVHVRIEVTQAIEKAMDEMERQWRSTFTEYDLLQATSLNYDLHRICGVEEPGIWLVSTLLRALFHMENAGLVFKHQNLGTDPGFWYWGKLIGPHGTRFEVEPKDLEKCTLCTHVLHDGWSYDGWMRLHICDGGKTVMTGSRCVNDGRDCLGPNWVRTSVAERIFRGTHPDTKAKD